MARTTRELTKADKDWVDLRNQLFKEGDILVIHERVVVEEHPALPDRKNVGKVLAEPGDELIVVGADCIGCFVQNKSHPERNFTAPPNCPEDEAWRHDRWLCRNVSATLVRTTEDHDWTEDFPEENGNYQHKCPQCENSFTGHKRRIICKACWVENEQKWANLTKEEQYEVQRRFAEEAVVALGMPGGGCQGAA